MYDTESRISAIDSKAAYLAAVATLNAWGTAYHTYDNPLVPNGVYDEGYSLLKQYEAQHPGDVSPNSPTKRVGGPTLPELAPAAHDQMMGSLESCMTDADTQKFLDDNIRKSGVAQIYCAEPKYDGLALSLRYVHGKLQRAATRGTGLVGEDVTEQAKTLRGVPHELDAKYHDVPLLEVRGEGLMPVVVFERLNAEAREAGRKEFANPRNAAAGAIRQLDPSITAERSLQLYAYSFGELDTPFNRNLPRTQMERLQLLKDMGFEVSKEVTLVSGEEARVAHFKAMAERRSSLPFEIDGVVFKLNSVADQEELGWATIVPRFAFAAKFEPPRAITRLLGIDVSVGRTGQQTPVGRLAPVRCGGVTVSNVNLFNQDEIERLGIRVGDEIEICRAGDVIPDVVRVVSSTKEGGVYQLPSECPCCGAPVEREVGKALHYCSGSMSCPAQQLQAMVHYGSRATLSIDGLGEGTVEKLMGANLVSTPADLYALDEVDVARLPGFGLQSARNLVEAIHSAVSPEWAKLIHALGIPGIGESSSKTLAKAFRTPEALKAASYAEVLALKDMGPISATSVVNFFHREATVTLFDALMEHLTPVAPAAPTSNVFEGKSVVITGTLSKARSSYEKRVEDAGGKVSGSVSKKTDYVLAGSEAGTKLTKAETLNKSGDASIVILDEAGFEALFGA